jgi:hypothetical protein
MEIKSIYDKEFLTYGRVITGYDTEELVAALEGETPLPEGTDYVASEPALEKLPIKALFQSNEYGGMPIQMGWCNGHNTKLNCLEYHRDSEVNCGSRDFILLLAKLDDVENGKLDTAKVKAFRCPAGVPVEVYGSTLHYAPCDSKAGEGFQVLIVLPLGTNGPKPEMTPVNEEDTLLWACNKWLLAHPESGEAAQGAVAALTGENIDIAQDIL